VLAGVAAGMAPSGGRAAINDAVDWLSGEAADTCSAHARNHAERGQYLRPTEVLVPISSKGDLNKKSFAQPQCARDLLARLFIPKAFRRLAPAPSWTLAAENRHIARNGDVLTSKSNTPRTNRAHTRSTADNRH
jgi:hypothetical protein